MFQKRHFEALATALQELDPGALGRLNRARMQHEATVDGIASMCAKSNPRFNRERFLRACQPGANVRARTR